MKIDEEWAYGIQSPAPGSELEELPSGTGLAQARTTIQGREKPVMLVARVLHARGLSQHGPWMVIEHYHKDGAVSRYRTITHAGSRKQRRAQERRNRRNVAKARARTKARSK